MSAASAGLISGRLVMGVHAEHGGEDGAGPGRRRLEAQPGIAVDRAVEGDRLQVEAAVDLGAGIGLALDDERHARQMIEVAAVLKPLRMGLVQDEAEIRSEEHTSELQSLMRISYAFLCLKKKKSNTRTTKQEKD